MTKLRAGFLVLATAALLATLPADASAATAKRTATYTVNSGDTIWKVARRLGINYQEILKINGFSERKVLQIGQVIKLPGQNTSRGTVSARDQKQELRHVVQSGDTPWVLARKYGVSLASLLVNNGLNEQSVLNIGQVLLITDAATSSTVVAAPAPVPVADPVPSANQNEVHTVISGDTPWLLAQRFGVSLEQLLAANGLNEASILNIGQTLVIPKGGNEPPLSPATPADDQIAAAANGAGEYLDWWTQVDKKLFPIGSVAEITDVDSGLTYRVKRFYGVNHADVETLTAQDTETMYNIWGRNWSWDTRAVIVTVNGHRIAASASGMPHSIETIKAENNFNGHSDIHFLNSRSHNTNSVIPEHQRMVRKAAGK